MDDENTGLCGFTTATYNFTAPSRYSGEVTVKYVPSESSYQAQFSIVRKRWEKVLCSVWTA